MGDPYRWLEDTNASETRACIETEGERTEEWLSQVSARANRHLSELWDYPLICGVR